MNYLYIHVLKRELHPNLHFLKVSLKMNNKNVMKKITLLINRLLITLGFILIPLLGFSQSPKTYNSSSTFTVPAGVTTLDVQAWGAGGRGSSRTSNGNGGGGGGGAYAANPSVSVNALNAPYTVTVGAGSTSNNNHGGDSWFSTTGTIFAQGGRTVANNTATGGAGGLASASTGTTKWNGGTGVAGASTYGGGGGSSAGTSAAGNTGTTFTGGTAPAGGGNGGNGKNSPQGVGVAGSVPGGGGGGGYRTSSSTRRGGNGANGQVILTWTCPTYGLSSTAMATPSCPTNGSVVTLTSSAAGLPTGTYTVSYTLSGANTGSSTASMTVSTAGGGTFTTTAFANAGVTTITINTLSSGVAPDNCSTTITSSNTANTTVPALPTITSTTPNSRDLAGTVTLGATSSAGTISWYSALTGGTLLGTGTSYTTTSISSSTTYYVSTNDGGCISAPRIAVVATVNFPEINIQGNTSSITDGDTTPQYIDFTDFGESVVGVPISKTFLIQNTGTGTLTVSSVTFSGGNPTDFTLTTPPASTIAAGSSSTFVVTFIAGAAGSPRSTTMNINSNDSNEAVYDILIRSTATVLSANAEIAIEANGTYIPDGKTAYNIPDFTDFGNNYTSTPTTRTYTIFNTGSTTLNITGLTTSNTTDFSISTAPSATVAPGSSTTFAVTFNTTTAGAKTTTISIANDDTTGSENPYTFGIQGTGVVFGAAQNIDVLGNGNSIPDNSIFTSTTDFTILGDSFVGSSIIRTYTIKNTGTNSLGISSRAITGTNSGEFVASAISSSIGGLSQTTFTITFTPTGTGVRTATITINNTTSGSEGTYSFNIEGNGIATAPGVSEIDVQGNSVSITNGDTTPSIDDSTDFGSNQIQTNTTKTFTIRNYGGSDLILSGTPKVSISGSSDFTVTSQPATPVASLGTTTFTIQFNPVDIIAPTSRTAVVSIANNDSDENPYTFTIQGTAIQTYFDSDGDGVFDNVDIDDDNDGIRDITEEVNCNNSNGHKVNYKFLNETFGSGGRTTINTTYEATTSYIYQNASTPTLPESGGASIELQDGKYTVGSSAQIASWADQYWYKGVDHTGDTNGRMAIFNASYTPGIFYTALITGALPNIPITYSFYVLNLDRTDAPNIATRLRPNMRVEFRDINDVVLATINTGDITPTTAGNLAGNWQQFTADLTLNVNTFKVIFINNNTGGEGNDLALDDILISQQLCDLENDGVADVFDLDADNDGIEDVIEAGLGSISNGKGKIDVTWVDVNGNGLLDSAEPAASLQALDSDGDGIPNYIDLDSDNDSLFDVDESGAGNTNAVTGYINGDGDINGDGVGDGPESETFRSKDTNGDTVVEGFGDGILDIYDYGTGGTFSSLYGNSGQGTANLTYPAATYLKDTDNDGIPDYLDIMSNGSTFDIANTLLIYNYKTLDTNNNGIIDGTADIDKDGILDAFDTNTSQFGSPRDLNTKLFLDFDGRNDYAQSTAILGGLSNTSLMAWIDLNPAFASEGIIMGQNNFQIRITSDKKLEAIVNGIPATYNTALDVSRWYNVAAVYGGGNLKLYLNGNLVITQAASGAISADASLLTIGKNPSSSTQYFKGKIDEVRVFNTALTDSQLQRMVYQEINDFGGEIRGEIVPKNVATSPASLPFANLLRYYRMDNYKDDIIDDLTTPAIDVAGTKIYNHKNIYIQQAPMPFETITTGNFATAVNNPLKDIRGLDVTDNDYSIIKVHHDITETSNSVDLGMFVDSGKTILMNNDTKMQNDWYLKLDGKIDLVGMSQLVQTLDSDLDATSSGSIERDQQGQANKYSYNYWCSPVSQINSSLNNQPHSVNDVLRDGTNPANPIAINWVAGYDGAVSSPISLARYWIYKFDLGNAYSNWTQIGETGSLDVGKGFTLKGAGTTGKQNLTFVGKPNNGTISNSVGNDELLLTGNPYPSALDADKFITDNIGSIERSDTTPAIDGALYFWEHYSTNNSHVLSDYQGGYAIRNLAGGVATISTGVDFISGVGTTSKLAPNRYIPVGQGFFVNGKIGPGVKNVVFNNSQRYFVKETDAASQSMYKIKPKNKTKTDNNASDPAPTDTYKRVRLGYNSYNESFHRQTLLAFMDDKANSEMNLGYDALNIDGSPSDMYLLNGDNELAIEGEGAFDENASFPIGVRLATAGKVSFALDALENFDTNQDVFVYDKVTNTYNSIKNKLYEIELPAGTDNSRFSLHFKDKSSSNDKTLGLDENNSNAIQIAHIQNSSTLKITNNLTETSVEKVTLFNILGQSIADWKIENQDQQDIRIPIKNISSGIYIVKIKTNKGETSKKLIIK